MTDLTQHFRENQYFSNPTISRKWELPQDAPSAPEDGSITQEMRAFDEDDLVSPVSPTYLHQVFRLIRTAHQNRLEIE